MLVTYTSVFRERCYLFVAFSPGQFFERDVVERERVHDPWREGTAEVSLVEEQQKVDSGEA